MSAREGETTRETVKTYVPSYQKEIWREHADELGMSQSEFVRTMVQAGRRDFGIEAENTGSADATPRGEGLKDQVRGVLESDGPLSYEELLSMLIGDFEDALESTIEELQSENGIQHSPREGGYRVVEPTDE